MANKDMEFRIPKRGVSKQFVVSWELYQNKGNKRFNLKISLFTNNTTIKYGSIIFIHTFFS